MIAQFRLGWIEQHYSEKTIAETSRRRILGAYVVIFGCTIGIQWRSRIGF